MKTLLADRRAALVFAGANLLFLLVDVALAHSSFLRSRAELVPLAVSAVAGPLVLIAAFLRRPLPLIWTSALACVGTGFAGLALHLGSGTLTLHRLVYSAPIVAPLSYAGLGCLVLVAAYAEDPQARGRWLELLAGLGLLGNFALCLLDHAQNGFWAPVEWLSVLAGALGGVAFMAAAAVPGEREAEQRFLWIVVAAMAGVGVLGAALHARADFAARTGTLLERLQYGAPIFAPLLFADLAALGALGLFARAPQPSD